MTKLKKRTIDTKWFSWIPTNLGYLNYNYIADTNNLVSVFGKDNFEKIKLAENKIRINLKNTHLSDINEILANLLNYDELFAKAQLTFEQKTIFNETIHKNQPVGILGVITINYSDCLIIKSSFDIHANGYIVIEEISLSYDGNIINDPDLTLTLSHTIANAMYTLIKKIVHGDKHHHQKIDTIIGVYTKFDARQILTDLGFQIKRLEKYVKSQNNISTSLAFGNTVGEIYNTATGFMSYIRTFDNIFISSIKEESSNDIKISQDNSNENTHYIGLSSIENVITSIQSMVNIENNKMANSNKMILFIVTLIALFASLNIFYSTLVKNHESSLALSINNYLTVSLSKFDWLSFLSARDIIMAIIFFFLLLLLLVTKNAMGYYGKRWLGDKVKYSLYEIYTLTRYLDMNEEEKKKHTKEYAKVKRYKFLIQVLVLSFPFLLFIMILSIFLNFYSIFNISLVLFFISVILLLLKVIKI